MVNYRRENHEIQSKQRRISKDQQSIISFNSQAFGRQRPEGSGAGIPEAIHENA